MSCIPCEKCFEALNKLISIFAEGEKPEYEEALNQRLHVLNLWLEKDENQDLKNTLENILKPSNQQIQEGELPKFPLTVLGLLRCLAGSLEAEQSQTPPPHQLSVPRRRLAASAVQLAVVLALLPALPPGVGVSLEQRTEFSAAVRAASAQSADQYQRRELAVLALEQLLELAADRWLSEAVLSAHAGDLLAALLLVTAAPLAAPGSRGMTADRRRHLQLQRDRLQPRLAQLLALLPDGRAVRELLVLQRCALAARPPRRWLHERATWWVFQYARRPGGLVTVTDGLLQFWEQDRLDDVELPRIQAVAKLLASPHPEFNNEDYFRHLAAEVLALLRIPLADVRVSTLRVAGALAASLWESETGAGYVETGIVRPLLGPLAADRTGAVSESEVTDGVTAAWQLFVAGSEPDAGCLDCLRPYAAALFQLHAVLWTGVSHLRAPCRELLERLLRRLGSGEDALELVLFGAGLGEDRRFALGDGGGARVEPLPPDEADSWLVNDDGAAAAFVALLCGSDAPQLVAGVFAALLGRMRDVMTLESSLDPEAPAADAAGRGGQLRAWERRLAERRRAFRRGLLTLRALAALAESEQARRHLDDAGRLLPAVGALLRAFADGEEEHDSGGGEPGLLRVETVCLALGVTAGLLARESTTSDAWAAARRLVPDLQRLAAAAGSARVRDMASDLRELVLTNGVVNHQSVTADRYQAHRAAATTGPPPPPQPSASRGSDDARDGQERVPAAADMTYERAMYDLVDPLLPVRAHALVSLSQLLERRDPDTWRHRQQLLHVFKEKLADDDSYVYLAAVRGLACLADLFTDQVVPGLCRQYVSPDRDADTRLKLGEAIVQMVRNLGDVAPKYGAQLLNTFLAGCRDQDHLVRASSLSSLAEVCRLLRFSLASSVHEIFSCLSALIDTDDSIEVRRAAVVVIGQILTGLGADALKVLEELLPALYRRLKALLRREQDPALLHHVQTALDQLEMATRQLLFPSRPLQKRIVVLDPPQ